MNQNHAKLCGGPEWAAHIQDEVLPPVTAGVDLGTAMVEIGPGPGAATAWLCERVERLVVVEADAKAAAALADQYAGTNVEVHEGDGARLEFPDATFDSAGCFTMLHHVPTKAAQDAIFAQVRRVLRPGGVFLGSDSLPSDGLREFHEGDTYNPVDPERLAGRLSAAGFERVDVRVDNWLSFVAFRDR